MRRSLTLALLATVLIAAGAVHAATLDSGFANPPPSARIWVYWFWLNGNITRVGITKDLEAMKRAGVGGVLIMEVDQGAPLGPVPFSSPKWHDLFRFMIQEAHRLGIQVNMNDDAGWDGSGGPWIKPAQAMKKLVSSETTVAGGTHFDAVLPQPPTVGGFYRDIAVLAYPTPKAYTLPDWQRKCGLQRGDFIAPATYPSIPPAETIQQGKEINLTSKMSPNGHLVWTAPAGQWTIQRFGYTLTGAVNAPSPVSGRGLECDKLSPEGIDAQFKGFISKFIDDAGPFAGPGKTLVRTHIDSWENGSQNWTARFRQDFQARRGYDLLPYLPAMTGRVVDSVEVTERFLYDVRQTISDLIVENYAGRCEQLAQQHGLGLSIEAYGGTTVDEITYAGRADEPMGEFWWTGYYDGTIREMASAAHIYGKPICGAESFTSGSNEKWLAWPGNIKSMGDRAFCAGINRFVVHRYALQPWPDRRPGMSMGPWGLHYERTQTWWNEASAWHKYVARCQYLLQQGLPVVDVLCLEPEGAARSFPPPNEYRRAGYRADSCSAEALMTRAKVRDGRIVFPERSPGRSPGMSYRILVLPHVETFTVPLLKKIGELVDAGATVVGGPAPKKAPGLTNYPYCDRDVADIAARLWGSGKIISKQTPLQVLAARHIAPDFVSDRLLDFIHHRIGDVDVYFVANPFDHAVNATCSFRIAGRVPELWDARTGARTIAATYVTRHGMTRLPLRLDPAQSVFVVFRQPDHTDPVQRITRDGKDVWPSIASQAPITILKAMWGPAGDPAHTKDVTDQVRRKVESGATSFVVAELASEGDPAVNIVKTLVVNYEVNGKHYIAKATDPQTIVFQVAADHAADFLGLTRASNGRLIARPAAAGSYVLTTASGKTLRFKASAPMSTKVGGPWDLRFPPHWGAPPQITLPVLQSWSERPEKGVKYFSGTATYRTSLRVPASFVAAGQRLILDLGDVQVIARVSLNGKDLGLLWKSPYRVDVTGAAKAGLNSLVVQVTNLWPNRMIGDAQLPEDSARNPNGTLKAWPKWLEEGKPSPTGRYTFTTWRLWHKNDKLLPSGLLGPVKLISEQQIVLK